MTAGSISFKLKNDPCELDQLGRYIRQFGLNHGLSEKIVFEINLVLDELFTNVVSYGYTDSKKHWIRFEIHLDGTRLILRMEDNGKRFNPQTIKPPNIKCLLQEREIGGLGIHLIRKIVDDLRYERVGRKNVLTLTKNLA